MRTRRVGDWALAITGRSTAGAAAGTAALPPGAVGKALPPAQAPAASARLATRVVATGRGMAGQREVLPLLRCRPAARAGSAPRTARPVHSYRWAPRSVAHWNTYAARYTSAVDIRPGAVGIRTRIVASHGDGGPRSTITMALTLSGAL